MRITCKYIWDNPASAQIGKCLLTLLPVFQLLIHLNSFWPINKASIFSEAVFLPLPSHNKFLGNNQGSQEYLDLKPIACPNQIYFRYLNF